MFPLTMGNSRGELVHSFPICCKSSVQPQNTTTALSIIILSKTVNASAVLPFDLAKSYFERRRL